MRSGDSQRDQTAAHGTLVVSSQRVEHANALRRALGPMCCRQPILELSCPRPSCRPAVRLQDPKKFNRVRQLLVANEEIKEAKKVRPGHIRPPWCCAWATASFKTGCTLCRLCRLCRNVTSDDLAGVQRCRWHRRPSRRMRRSSEARKLEALVMKRIRQACAAPAHDQTRLQQPRSGAFAVVASRAARSC